MYSANPFSSYDLLPLHEKKKAQSKRKAQGGAKLGGEDPTFPSTAQNAAGNYTWQRMGQIPPANPAPVDPVNLIPLQEEPQYFVEDQGRTPVQPRQRKPFPTELLYTGLAALDRFIPGEEIEDPVVQPMQTYNEHPYGTGSQAIAKYGANLPCADCGKKMKKYPYGGILNGGDPTKPKKPKVETYTPETLKADTDFARAFVQRKEGPSFMASNATVGKVGEPRIQFEYQNPQLLDTSPKQGYLPRGVTVDDVFLNQQGQYGYLDPQYDKFVVVDPTTIYSLYGKKKATTPSSEAQMLTKMEYGGEIPEAKGGWIAKAAASIKRRGTKGKCTPITKPGCTGRAKALAKTFKKIARNRKHEDGGMLPYFVEGEQYDLSDQEVADLISQGYELDML